MKPILLPLAAAALLLSVSSCVTKEKYMLAENGRLEALARADRLGSELNLARTDISRLSDQVTRLVQDTTRLGNSLRAYQQMLAGNVDSQEKLTAMLNKKMEQLAERENTINELQSMINAQQEKVQALLNSVKDALLGFNSDELTVREENGKVYVAMSDKLLFESGSARVDKRGKEALAKLANVLNQQTNIDVYIEGHTDSKPIHTTQFKDNWDLSAPCRFCPADGASTCPSPTTRPPRDVHATAAPKSSWRRSSTSFTNCLTPPTNDKQTQTAAEPTLLQGHFVRRPDDEAHL